MNKKLPKKPKGIERLRSHYGRMFVLSWVIGLVLFFFVPIFTSIKYSFSTVTITAQGIQTVWAGLAHYRELIMVHPTYIDTLLSTIGSLGVKLPLIVALSLILAIILNQKFKGRMIARAIFFLPVIIATGGILDILSKEYIPLALVTTTASAPEMEASQYGSMIDFTQILGNLGLPAEIEKLVSGYISEIFSLLWSCGIQIVLFIAGLQTIPDQLYEVSKVEGASKWEEFWYITIPMLGPTLLLVMVYTMIDLFTQNTGIIKMAMDTISNGAVYDRSSAMLWIYFAVVGVVMSIIIALYNHFCTKRWN